MKRIVKFIILSLVLVVLLPIFGGCESCIFPERKKAEKYCNDYLAAIPVEFEGYKIRYCEKNKEGYEPSNVPKRSGGQYMINDKEILIESDGFYEFKIIYEGEETIIDKEFMANNSEAYNKINNVWKGYDKENPEGWDIQNEVESVFVFDDNVFIITYSHGSGLYRPEKYIPKCLYRYDLKTKKVQYCDSVSLKIDSNINLIIYKYKEN